MEKICGTVNSGEEYRIYENLRQTYNPYFLSTEISQSLQLEFEQVCFLSLFYIPRFFVNGETSVRKKNDSR